MTVLKGRRIVLGVSGGIAAYKAAELVRLLVKAGADVHVVLSEGGARFVTAVTFQALSGNTVWTDLWDARMPNNMAHIDLGRDADAILVAPATADFIARVAQGRADDLLSTLCLARAVPLIVAPAMNRQMWEAPPTQRNVAQIRADGVAVFGPAAGDIQTTTGQLAGLTRVVGVQTNGGCEFFRACRSLLQGGRLLVGTVRQRPIALGDVARRANGLGQTLVDFSADADQAFAHDV